MPFVKNTHSKSHRVVTTSRKVFVGRTNELQFFRDYILTPEDPAYNIISISGQAGVGKSTFIARLIEEARTPSFENYCFTALVNEHQTVEISIMDKFAEQLQLEGDFEKLLASYKETLRKLQIERNVTGEPFWRKATTDITSSIVKEVPIVGSILEKGTELGIGYALDEIHYHSQINSLNKLERLTEDLTKAFVKDLNRITETSVTLPSNRSKRQQRILLFFDTFEQLASVAAPWLLEHFLPANLNNNIVLIIAGRDPLDRSAPGDPKQWLPYYDDNIIHSILLDSFNKEETLTFLSTKNVIDPILINRIWQLSQGLPLYLSLLTSNLIGEIDPTEDVIENFLRWIPEHEKVKRKLALDISLLSLPFNLDDLDAFTYLPLDEDTKKEIYRWLIGLSFVRSNFQDGRYSYHNLAQELFSRYLYKKSPKAYYATRKMLVDYYKQMLRKLEIGDTKKRYLILERTELLQSIAHQLLLLSDENYHIEAMSYILEAHEKSEQVEGILRLLRDLAQEHLNNQANSSARQVCNILISYLENKHDRLNIINNIINKLQINQSFDILIKSNLYSERGELLLLSNYLEKSLLDFNYAIELNPNNITALSRRGQVYRKLGQNNKALDDFSRALSLSPNSSLQHTLQEQKGSILRKMKNYEEAIKAFMQSILLDCKCMKSWCELIYTYMRLGYSKSDIVKIIKSINIINDDTIITIQSRALALREMGFNEEALIEINQAIQIDPQRSDALLIRGNIFFARKKYAEALNDFSQAIKITPDSIDTLLERGKVYNRMGRHTEALADFEQAQKLVLQETSTTSNKNIKNNHTMVFTIKNRKKLYDIQYIIIYHHAHTLLLIGRTQEALDDFNKAIKLYPDDGNLYFERGRIYTFLKSYQEALDDFNRAIQLDPESLHVIYKEKGIILTFMEMYQEAIKAFIASLTYQPSCKNCWLLLAETYQKTCSPSQIAGQLRQAITIENHSAIYYRGEAMSSIGLYEDAIIDLTSIIEFHPNALQPLLARGKAYLQIHCYEEALSDFEQILNLSNQGSQIPESLLQEALKNSEDLKEKLK